MYEALADVVCGSPEFALLFSELDKTWARLRGLRKCFRVIQDALSGHMPGPLMSRWQTVVPLDYDVSFPLDEHPADLWSQALERLLADPDAVPLPRSDELRFGPSSRYVIGDDRIHG